MAFRVKWFGLISCFVLGAVTLASIGSPALAQAQDEPQSAGSGGEDNAKSAFESAKELGTPEAWNAFLGSYPDGFYADLARAYLKKAPEGQRPATPEVIAAPAPSSARAAERICAERDRLRSHHSKEPTTITFVNASGMYRSILWIDFDGNLKDYGGLNSGEEIVLKTFRTHPWMIATGPGDCLQIFLPAAEPSVVELVRLDADNASSRPERSSVKTYEKPKQIQKPKPTPPKKLVCGKNYKLKNGRCVLLQNCGKNAYRSAEGDCYCKKGYVMTGGKCRWPQDKNGFEVAPWKKQGCSGLQARCNKGDGPACMKYEETCQVN